jgi:hypothetical protein
MTPEEQDKQDAEMAAGMRVVKFGEDGLAEWKRDLKNSLGMRELARLLLAGVDPDEAYRRALEVDKEASPGSTQPPPTPKDG